MKRFVKPPSPAMIVACIALVVALAGTSIAATNIGRNNVGANELARVIHREKIVVVAADTTGVGISRCKTGEELLGGGVRFPNAAPGAFINVGESGPWGLNAWYADAFVGSSAGEQDMVITALCLQK